MVLSLASLYFSFWSYFPTCSPSICASTWPLCEPRGGDFLGRWRFSMCPSHFLLELSQLQPLALSWASLLALCCPHLPSGHHVCPCHGFLQPEPLKMGLTSTGSVFVDVLKPLGVLQSSWFEGGAAVRQWVVLAASEERERQNRPEWALPFTGEHTSHFCQRAPLRRPVSWARTAL